MKRSWIGFGLLVLLLVISLAVTAVMTRLHDEIELDLQQASRCAMDKDWDSAELFFRRARENWESREHFRACFSDHTPSEEIDSDFAAAEIFRQSRDRVAFAAACASLATQTAAIGEAHEPVWWNFF